MVLYLLKFPMWSLLTWLMLLVAISCIWELLMLVDVLVEPKPSSSVFTMDGHCSQRGWLVTCLKKTVVKNTVTSDLWRARQGTYKETVVYSMVFKKEKVLAISDPWYVKIKLCWSPLNLVNTKDFITIHRTTLEKGNTLPENVLLFLDKGLEDEKEKLTPNRKE